LDGAHVNAHANLGAALVQQGHGADAIAHLRRAIELDPGHAEAHSNLGIALAMTGRLEDAIGQVEESVALSADPRTLDLLGALYAEAGRFGDAVEAVRRAIERSGESPGVGAMKAKLERYRERIKL
jgi:Flp pilus assembly protein TadD